MTAASSSRAKEHAAAAAAILLLSLVGYGFLLAPGAAPYSQFSDFLPLGLASKTVLRESLAAGRLPFWRSDMFSGFPAWSDPQNSYANPLNILFWLIDPVAAVGPEIWLCFAAAGAAGYALGASLGLGFWARVLTAAALMFDAKQARYLELFPGSHWTGAVFVPLLFAAVLSAAARPDRRRAALIGLAGGLCLVSGQLQLAYDAALFIGAFALWRAIRLPRVQAGRWLACLAGGAVLSAGLSAGVLVPLGAEAPWLSRGGGSFLFFASGHPARWSELLGFLSPGGLSPESWEDAACFGLAPLGLAAAGALLARRRPPAAALCAGFAASCVLAACEPLQRLLFAVLPGFALFRLPGRFLFLSGWFGVALAGLGADELIARLARARWKRLVAPLAAGLAAAMALEAGARARGDLRMTAAENLRPPQGLEEFFRARPGDYRVLPLGRRALNFGWAAPMRIQLPSGFGSYNYARYQTYCDMLRWNQPRSAGARVWTDFASIGRPDLLDALGVRYLVSPEPVALPRPRFKLAARLAGQTMFELYRGFARGDVYVYENAAARPRAFFAEAASSVRGQDAALAAVAAESFARMAVVEGAPPAAEAPSREDRVRTEALAPGFLRLALAAQGPRYLVVGEVWNPGWRARLDGRAVALHRTELALMGAWIPAGEHRLELVYRPVGWDAGLGLSALSAAACVLLWIA